MRSEEGKYTSTFVEKISVASRTKSAEVGPNLLALSASKANHSLWCSMINRVIYIYIIGERAKRARHSQVCSIENRGYILYTIITRNVLLSAQMGERASVVLIWIITSRYNEVK